MRCEQELELYYGNTLALIFDMIHCLLDLDLQIKYHWGKLDPAVLYKTIYLYNGIGHYFLFRNLYVALFGGHVASLFIMLLK